MEQQEDVDDHQNISDDEPVLEDKVDNEEAQPVQASHRYPSKRIFGRHGAYPCTVCKTNPSKYKFTCCRFGYCSIECFREHSKPGVCNAPATTSIADRPIFKRRATNVSLYVSSLYSLASVGSRHTRG